MGSSIQENERMSRFVTDRKGVAATSGKVRRSQFMPYEVNGELCLSVFRTSGLQESEVWGIADKYLTRPVFGRGDIRAAVFVQLGLRISPDEEPPRHANIVGWPPAKEARILLSIELTNVATTVPRPVAI